MAKKEKKKGTWRAVLAVVVVLGVIGAVFGGKDDGNAKKSDATSAESIAKEEKGTSGIEVENSEEQQYGNIEDFSYEISGDVVALDKYTGKLEILEIKPFYVIEGVEYRTDLSDFQVGIGNSDVNTLILDEGITEVKDAIFNSSDVEKVYFPKSMAVVYDNTLAYLHPEDGQTIKIYYGGTQEEWGNIFTQYQRESVKDAEGAEAKGEAVADKLNEMVGHEYDSSLFEYFFSASPDDLK